METLIDKFIVPIWPKKTAAQTVAEQLCAYIDPGDVDNAIKDVADRREKAGSVCETTIIVFVAIQLYIAGYVWLGLTNFKALGIELGESSTSCFVAYVIYNMIWVIRMGAFFKVLVLDALFEKLVAKSSKKNLTQALDAHLSQFLFSDAVNTTIASGKQGYAFRLLRNYSRNGVPLIYSLYFYITLIFFIADLIYYNSKGLTGIVMSIILLVLTSISTALGLKTVILPRSKTEA